MRTHKLFWLMCLAFLTTATALAAAHTWTSPATRTAVVELYTSEGCSSCPPADRWLSSLKNESGLFRNFVPIAFHVDYWDDIGWKDRFASPAYSARQRRYAQSGTLSQVYTPGVVLQGNEWRHWGSSANSLQSDAATVGPLQLSLDENGHTTLRWWPAEAASANLLGTVVLLGADLTTQVKRGENSGRELHHDFVALGTITGPMVREDDHYRVTLTLPRSNNTAPRYALAGWVSNAGKLTPLQAVGGWLSAPP